MRVSDMTMKIINLLCFIFYFVENVFMFNKSYFTILKGMTESLHEICFYFFKFLRLSLSKDYLRKGVYMAESVDNKRVSTAGSNSAADNEEIFIQCITKAVRLPEDLPLFDDVFYEQKRDFWRKRISGIKNVVAPMVDQRSAFIF